MSPEFLGNQALYPVPSGGGCVSPLPAFITEEEAHRLAGRVFELIGALDEFGGFSRYTHSRLLPVSQYSLFNATQKGYARSVVTHGHKHSTVALGRTKYLWFSLNGGMLST
jgi:hypothetical protein